MPSHAPKHLRKHGRKHLQPELVHDIQDREHGHVGLPTASGRADLTAGEAERLLSWDNALLAVAAIADTQA